MSGSVFALLAGFLGALASLSAKLSMGTDYLRDMCVSGLSGWTHTHGDTHSHGETHTLGGTALCDWVRPDTVYGWDSLIHISVSVTAVSVSAPVKLWNMWSLHFVLCSFCLHHCSCTSGKLGSIFGSHSLFTLYFMQTADQVLIV